MGRRSRKKISDTKRMRAYRSEGLQGVENAVETEARKPKAIQYDGPIGAEANRLASIERALAISKANEDRFSPSDYKTPNHEYDPRSIVHPFRTERMLTIGRTRGRTRKAMTATSTYMIPVPNTGRRPKKIRETLLGTMSAEDYRARILGSSLASQLARAKALRQRSDREPVEATESAPEDILVVLRSVLSPARGKYNVDWSVSSQVS